MGAIDYHPAPVWLTESYVEEILRRKKQDQGLKLTYLDVKPATAKGENYASIMTRIKVEYVKTNSKATEIESYIVKTTYENDPDVAAIFDPYKVTCTEMLMYEKVLPKLNELLKEIGDTDKLFAETIYVDYEHEAIIFEDLAVSNYGMANRLEGMDMELAKLSLKKLAKMHATAAVMNERQPGLLTNLDRGIFNRYTKGFAPFFEGMFEVASNFAENCGELGNYYKDKLLKLKQKVMEYNVRVYDSQSDHFKTLTHGDFWTNNVMVRRSQDTEKTVKDMILIDFQFCNWSTPAVDLHYFFNTSLNDEVRFDHEDDLVKYYHSVLVETLRQLNFKGFIPTLHQMVVQIEQGRFNAVVAAIANQPMMINDKTDDADFNSLMGSDERSRNFRKLLYTNKRIQDSIKRILPVFDRRGLLEVID